MLDCFSHNTMEDRSMKKIAIGLSCACLMLVGELAVVNASEHPDTGPGCGLGKIAWADSEADHRTIIPQLLMSTTNTPIIPLQALSISSGTAGCRNNGRLWAQEKAALFARINLDNVAEDMAQGGGEHLASLATLLGVPTHDQEAFFTASQHEYARLAASGDPSDLAVIKVLNGLVDAHPVFAKASSHD